MNFQFKKFIGHSLKPTGTISSYFCLQVITAAISILRIPITLKAIGIEGFGVFVVSSGFWALLTIGAESIRRETQVLTANSKFPDLKLGNLVFDFIAISGTIISIFCVLELSGNLNSDKVVKSLIIFGIGALFHSLTSYLRGVIEGNGLVAAANILNLSGYLIAFPIYILSTKTQDISVITFAYVLSFEIPGFLYLAYIKYKSLFIKIRLSVSIQALKNRLNWFMLQSLDLLSYSLDPFLITIILGTSSSAEYGVYQKFLILGTSVTTALGPLLAIGRETKSNHFNHRFLQIFNVLISLPIIMLLFLYGKNLIDLLSDNMLQAKNSVLFALTINAIVGVLTSSLIQRSNSGRLLRIRIFASGIASILGLLISIGLLSRFGIGVTFWSSCISLTINYAIIRIWKSTHASQI
jgi:O-antigen/teichoic acid export membrane protein